MYSRRATIEEKKNKQKAFLLIVFSIFFIGALFYWGIPLTVQYLGFLTDIRKTDSSINQDDIIPPPTPRFAPLPEATNKEDLELVATSEPGSTITFFTNSEKVEVLTNTNGEANHVINLQEGDNIIYAQAKDISQNESDNSERIIVVYDTTAPTLQIDTPNNDATFYGTREKQLTITGKTEPETRLTVNGRLVVPDTEGTFRTQMTLSIGENIITIKAEDKAGNNAEQQTKVTYYQ